MDLFQSSIIIVDNFYSDPMAVRDFALSLDYNKGENHNYQGVQSANLEIPGVKARLAKIVGAKKIAVRKKAWAFGSFRVAQEGDAGLSYVHFDCPDWAANVYLSPEPQHEGVYFYRHKKTGLLGPTTDLSRQQPWSEIRDMGVAIINGASKKMSEWELVHSVEYRFNRLVIFRGRNFFHAPGHGFGNSKNSARLTQHFFFDSESRGHV